MLMDFNSLVNDFARSQRIASSASDIDRAIGLKPEDFGTPLTPEEIEATRKQAKYRLELKRTEAGMVPLVALGETQRLPAGPYDLAGRR